MIEPTPVFPGFDRPDEESPFLSFVASEFHRRGTPRRYELSKKANSHPFVARLGMRVPEPLGDFTSMEDVPLAEMPQRFVLKFANGWSARGVMLLERLSDGRYFDHLSLRTRTADQIVATQNRIAESFGSPKPRWLLEELVEPLLPVGAVPFDYKFYCFNGVIGMIGQFDRNANPPRVALFDGQLRPLVHGRDYVRSRPAIQRGVPLVPLHAPEMMWWAQELSLRADSPFVSIDMYDSPAGPVFGEFTYSPGGTHRRMFQFSHKMLDRFDALFSGQIDEDSLRDTDLQCREQIQAIAPGIYRSLAGYVHNNGPRGAERLAAYYRDQGKRRGEDAEGSEWFECIARGWDEVRALLVQQLRSQVPTPPRR